MPGDGTPRLRSDGAVLEASFPEHPSLGRVAFAPGAVLEFGRGSDASIWIDHAAVSRRHARFEVSADGAVRIEDLGSRHGTRVNGTPLRTGRRIGLGDGDLVQLGPVPIRIHAVHERIRTEESGLPSEYLRTVEVTGSAAERALGVLVEVLRRLGEIECESDIGPIVLDRLLEVTRLERGLVVDLDDATGEAEVLASAGARLGSVSRSVLSAASVPGRIARLSSEVDLHAAASVVGAGVREIVCARIPDERGDGRARFLYLDSRESRSSVDDSIAEFVGASARACGLAFEGLARRRLESLRVDLERARVVQERLLPRAEGTLAGVAWRLASRPGSLLAGDFAGVAARPDGAVLAWVGDVAGKGPAAAMLMASAQSWLHAAAARCEPIVDAVASLSEFLCGHSDPAEFATLLVVLRRTDGSVEACDAGHGIAFLVDRAGGVKRPEIAGGPPIGLVPDAAYGSTMLAPASGVRIVIATDGVHEQQSPVDEGRAVERFGLERMADELGRAAGSPLPTLVGGLLAALESFAGADLDDDVTVLALEAPTG